MQAVFPEGACVVWAIGTTNKAKVDAVRAVAAKVFPAQSHIMRPIGVESGVSDQPMTAEETQRGAVNRAAAALCRALSETAAPTPSAAADDDACDSFFFGVGMEGGIERVGGRFFECGWMAIVAPSSNDSNDNNDNDEVALRVLAAMAENATADAAAVGAGNALLVDMSRLAAGAPVVVGAEEAAAVAAAVAAGTSSSSSPCAAPRLRALHVGIGSSARFEMSDALMHKIIHEGKELATVMDELTGEVDVRSGLGAMGILTAGHLGRAAAYEHGLLFALAPFLSADKYWIRKREGGN